MVRLIRKAPPRQKPARYGPDVQWDEFKHRWTKNPTRRSFGGQRRKPPGQARGGVYYVRYKLGGELYLAVGPDPRSLPVYQLINRQWVKAGSRWPEVTSSEDIQELSRGRVASLDALGLRGK